LALEGVITHFSTELEQAGHQTFVRIFGEIVRISKTLTKKGDEMAFVQLEDIRGSSKLVLFPSTWRRVSGLLNYGKVIIAEGKIDTSRGEPSILVDEIKVEIHLDSENIKKMQSAIEQQKNSPEIPPDDTQKTESKIKQDLTFSTTPDDKYLGISTKALPTNEQQHSEPALSEQGILPDSSPVDLSKQSDETEIPVDFIPPEPDIPPSYNIWNGDEDGNGTPAASETVLEPNPLSFSEEKNSYEVDSALKEKSAANPVQKESASDEVISNPGKSTTLQPPSAIVEDPDPGQAPILSPPLTEEEWEDKGKIANPQMLTIVMRSLGDKERDILRMRRVYGMLISDPGPDRFAFYVIERKRGYRLEFPSDTTHLTDALMKKLESLMGKENIILEPITIQ
jgi:DNA polymerase-3 subunit alpha